MTTVNIHRIVLPIFLLAASAAFAEEKSFDRHFDAPSGGHLRLQTDVGSVSVVGHDSRDVDVHVEVSGPDADRVTLDATQDASGVTVTGRRKSPSWLQWSVTQVKFKISVPRDYPVQAQTAGGSIDVHDASGAIDMRTSGGSIDAARLNGAALLRTSGGSIDIKDVVGDVDVHTSGGSIDLTNIDGKVKADTSGGGIHAAVRSNRGITLTTSGGGITLQLPQDVRASVDAETSGGSALCEFPVSTAESSGHQHLIGTINGGGDPIYLRTSGGGIHILKSSK
jgi:DUF4097 and DUF4098 domain-containing protein YvlB